MFCYHTLVVRVALGRFLGFFGRISFLLSHPNVQQFCTTSYSIRTSPPKRIASHSTRTPTASISCRHCCLSPTWNPHSREWRMQSGGYIVCPKRQTESSVFQRVCAGGRPIGQHFSCLASIAMTRSDRERKRGERTTTTNSTVQRIPGCISTVHPQCRRIRGCLLGQQPE